MLKKSSCLVSLVLIISTFRVFPIGPNFGKDPHPIYVILMIGSGTFLVLWAWIIPWTFEKLTLVNPFDD